MVVPSPQRDPVDRVDLTSVPAPPQQPSESPPGPRRPFLQIWFRCCHAYGRLTRNPAGDAYAGRCPRCGARCEVPIGPGGTSRRSFEAW